MLLSKTVAAERQEGQLCFYNVSGILYTCPEEDEERARLGVALLLTSDVWMWGCWPSLWARIPRRCGASGGATSGRVWRGSRTSSRDVRQVTT